MLEQLGTGGPTAERTASRRPALAVPSQPPHAFRQTGRLRCSPPHLSGTPYFPLAHLHIPPISPFVSISFFDKLKEQKKRGEKREAFIQQPGRHKGSGVPSIGVALTWLNSSSGVSLVMSLIPKTSYAPFTASHTKLNTKWKRKNTHTYTNGRHKMWQV